MGTRDPRVDAYIATSAEFAQPILRHLRTVVHDACPTVDETMKWRMPHFMYRGILCRMAAFKHHCAFGFWRQSRIMAGLDDRSQEAMGHFGRLTAVRDLPPRRLLRTLIRKAIAINDAAGAAPVRSRKRRRAPPKVPEYLLKALRGNAAARATYTQLSPFGQRDYVEWLEEAKRSETRRRRLATAIAWLSQGKSRSWKYERRRSAGR